jgi:osmotically-inducible protein OsmY
MSSSRDCESTSKPDPRRPHSSAGQRGVGTLCGCRRGTRPRHEALDIEAAIRDGLATRNTWLPDHRITVHAGPDGLVTLTGSVPTQDLRREDELSCWTVPGVRSLHDDLHVGH